MNLVERMRAEWNRRAKEDAHFYVAFGRREQSEEEFSASAAETMPAFEREFSRLPVRNDTGTRALEIGCGPGRLLLPMSRHFDEVHGVDVSDEMAAIARERLRDVSNAQIHVIPGTDLQLFADNYFDFVYSYTVFQHIPSHEVVLNYFREAHRVLKPGGVLCCQIRGTAPLSSEMGRESDTWTGCWFTADEIVRFAREERFPVVALSGLDTQYMWTTFRKAVAGVQSYAPQSILLKAVTATTHHDPIIPTRGRAAAVSLWIDGMPESASLADCLVRFSGHDQLGCYLSAVSPSGGCQLDARLPDAIGPGEYSVELVVEGQPVSGTHPVTVVEAPMYAPRVLSVSDGINLTSRYRVETGGAKVLIEDVANPEEVSFTVADLPVRYLRYECKDPITASYEFAFHLTDKTPHGHQRLIVHMGRRQLDAIQIEVVRS